MRTFFAIALPDASASELYRARSALRETWKGYRWISPENYHITLAFLGYQPEKTVESLRAAIPELLHGFRDFEIELTGVGFFGSPGLPRILLERVGRGHDELLRLQSAIRPAIEALIGWEKRAFRPHVSLGRPRRGAPSRPPQELPAPAETESKVIKPFRARELVLYRSETLADGAVYRPVEKWKLEGNT